MEIHRPEHRPFTPEEQRALDHFRERIHAQALHGGLSAQTVANVVKAMKDHPDFSSDILQVLFDEVEELRRLAPGLRLIDFD
jgi:hypothetical protein